MIDHPLIPNAVNSLSPPSPLLLLSLLFFFLFPPKMLSGLLFSQDAVWDLVDVRQWVYYHTYTTETLTLQWTIQQESEMEDCDVYVQRDKLPRRKDYLARNISKG